MSFCRRCGRITLRSFIYCPYCGMTLQAGPGMADATALPFERMDAMQAEFRARHIDEMLDVLDSLESDVEELLHGIGAPS
ncbi:MAG: hypothetical protein CVV51_09785 [Spirochaetae bacterium HGW-Spirochaetae-7]|jgi:hypothetical protein|nr:MAG: hypothetical protein CVV51_09785 [Spirochaetae bacterium HGW-Spirochaetae-7]